MNPKATIRSKVRPQAKAPVELLLKAVNDAAEGARKRGTDVRFLVSVDADRKVTIRDVEASTETRPAKAAIDEDLRQALAAARGRGQNRIAEIVSGPDMLSADDFARLVGTTRATINTWRQTRRVLALEGATRGYRYPSWQIGRDGKPFAALPKLFEQLGDSPWSVYRFLVQHHPELEGMTGADALRKGAEERALAVADSVAEAFA